MIGSIARRYAKAIIAVAGEEKSREETGEELLRLAAVAAAPEVSQAFANPLLSGSRRRRLAGAIAEELALSPTTRNFLYLLADHQRLDQLVGIADQYRKLLDRLLGRVRATITSAVALSDSQQERLVRVFEKMTGETVLVEMCVDEQLLGGVVVEIEGKVYDGSLRTQLHGLAVSVAGSHSYL